MKKILIGAVAGAVMLGSMAAVVFAAPNILNWGTEINPEECDKTGEPIINVVEKVINASDVHKIIKPVDVDSSEGNNFWAYHDFNRQIQVWAQEDGDYCVVVRDEGKFDAQVSRTSPGGGYTLDGDEDGTFEGGYIITIHGVLQKEPAWKTKGSLETMNENCNPEGVCPGYQNWIDKYFMSRWESEDKWWGWIYHAGRHGTWVNSSDGNYGDIY